MSPPSTSRLPDGQLVQERDNDHAILDTEDQVTSTVSLMSIPRELRDMIYAELAVHRGDINPRRAATATHGYGFSSLHSAEATAQLVRKGQAQSYNMIDTTLQCTLQLVCQRMKSEIDEISEKTSYAAAELVVICTGCDLMPIWTYLPLLYHPHRPTDVNVTLHLYTYNAIDTPRPVIFDLLDSIIKPYQPSRRGQYMHSEPMLECVCINIRVMRIACECHDQYTPNQYLDQLETFRTNCLKAKSKGWLLGYGHSIDVHGTHIISDCNTKTDF